MDGNPYANLIVSLRNDTNERLPSNYRLGKVISINPLKVEISGTVQDKEQLLLNNSLYLGNATMVLKRVPNNFILKRASDGVETEYTSYKEMEYYVPSKWIINAGDTVLTIPIEDEQKFIIICKVV